MRIVKKKKRKKKKKVKKSVVNVFVNLSRIVLEKIEIIIHLNVFEEIIFWNTSYGYNNLSSVNMDRIIILENGNIVEDGTHEELLKNPESKYSQLWNIQCK